MLSRFYAIGLSIVVLLLAAALAILGQQAALALTILGYLVVVFLAYHLDQERIEEERMNLVRAAESVLVEELQRNYCVADLFSKSLLSTAAWDVVVESGIVLKMEHGRFEPLLKCYSAIKFYNYDVDHENNFAHKQARVKDKMSDALKALGSVAPSHEDCCTKTLVVWAEKSKLEKACLEAKSRSEHIES